VTRTSLIRHVLLAPAAGSAVGAIVYGAAVRPLLPWPGWALDIGAVLFGAAGVLAGGILSFLGPPWRTDPREDSASLRSLRSPRWMPIGTVGFSMVAIGTALLLAGVPGLSWPVVAAGAAGGAAAFLMVRRLSA
jgi:hypothetical protein